MPPDLTDLPTDLLARYDRPGPRYTSYPTAAQFHACFDETCLREHITRAEGAPGGRGLSLYVHIPFCARVCYYCACNRVVTANRARGSAYLSVLLREIGLMGRLLDRARPVEQLHLGGGTPTYLADDELTTLIEALRSHFTLRDDDRGEYAIEVDPRELRSGTLATLRALGFNRLSLGVQDFDPAVQKAVNRIQSEAETLATIESARRLGFRSANVDLIYGLPLQTVTGFGRTLTQVISAAPDRISIFGYAHLPAMFKTQNQIDAASLPGPQARVALLRQAIDQLTTAGYVYIGMDHFARPEDELARAQAAGTLTRNFQGYSTHAGLDLIGLGVSAISQIGTSYSQSLKTLPAWESAVRAGRLPVWRGTELTTDDQLRRDVIMDLICHFQVQPARIEARHGVVFREYFAAELRALGKFVEDGLVETGPEAIRVSQRGRFLIRNICRVFDRYQTASQQTAPVAGQSRMI